MSAQKRGDPSFEQRDQFRLKISVPIRDIEADYASLPEQAGIPLRHYRLVPLLHDEDDIGPLDLFRR